MMRSFPKVPMVNPSATYSTLKTCQLYHANVVEEVLHNAVIVGM